MAEGRKTRVTCCGLKTFSYKTWTKLGTLCNMMGCLLIFLIASIVFLMSVVISSSPTTSESAKEVSNISLGDTNRTDGNSTVISTTNNFDRFKTPIFIFIIVFAGFGFAVAILSLHGVRTGKETVLNLWAGILVFYAVGQMIFIVFAVISYYRKSHMSFVDFVYQVLNIAILFCNFFFVGVTLNYRLQVMDDKNSKKCDAEMVGLVSPNPN